MMRTGAARAAGTFSIAGEMTVARLGFGALRITGKGAWGLPPDRRAALAVVRRAVELGVDCIDTADAYGPGTSEELLAEALHPYPADLRIATKGGFRRPGPGEWQPDGRPAHLRSALEGSLRRLRLERIDLYQLHRPDPAVPFEESVGALADLRAEGKIRHVGLSNVGVAHIEAARAIVPVASVQNRFNTATRGAHEYNGVSDDETLAVVDYCAREAIAFFPWGPLAEGSIASERLAGVARSHGAQPQQIALAWLLRRSPTMIPIPGTSSLPHLAANVAAAAIELTAAEFETLSAA